MRSRCTHAIPLLRQIYQQLCSLKIIHERMQNKQATPTKLPRSENYPVYKTSTHSIKKSEQALMQNTDAYDLVTLSGFLPKFCLNCSCFNSLQTLQFKDDENQRSDNCQNICDSNSEVQCIQTGKSWCNIRKNNWQHNIERDKEEYLSGKR